MLKTLKSIFLKIKGTRIVINLKGKLHNNNITYSNDGIITSFRVPYIDDLKFIKTIHKCKKKLNKDIYDKWRQYIYTNLFQIAGQFSKKNIFIECGVGLGVRNLITLNYLEKINNKIYLIDSFEGLNPNTNSEYEEKDYNKNIFNNNKKYSFEEIKKIFKKYKQVKIIKGFIPEVLYLNKNIFLKKISFLHLDLNDGVAELKALKFFFPFLAKKAIIIFDDYLFADYKSKKIYDLINKFFKENKLQKPIGLPSGQGVFLKF